jgi:chaperone modulatory protein CbpM
MTTIEFHAVEIVDDAAPMHVAELLACAHVEQRFLVDMVEAGIVTPRGTSAEQWTFVRGDLRKVRTARRLMVDLDINPAGAALILELLDERNTLLRRLRELQTLVGDF